MVAWLVAAGGGEGVGHRGVAGARGGGVAAGGGLVGGDLQGGLGGARGQRAGRLPAAQHRRRGVRRGADRRVQVAVDLGGAQGPVVDAGLVEGAGEVVDVGVVEDVGAELQRAALRRQRHRRGVAELGAVEVGAQAGAVVGDGDVLPRAGRHGTEGDVGGTRPERERTAGEIEVAVRPDRHQRLVRPALAGLFTQASRR